MRVDFKSTASEALALKARVFNYRGKGQIRLREVALGSNCQ